MEALVEDSAGEERRLLSSRNVANFFAGAVVSYLLFVVALVPLSFAGLASAQAGGSLGAVVAGVVLFAALGVALGRWRSLSWAAIVGANAYALYLSVRLLLGLGAGAAAAIVAMAVALTVGYWFGHRRTAGASAPQEPRSA